MTPRLSKDDPKYSPWTDEQWEEAVLRGSLNIPAQPRYAAISLGPGSVFQTAEEVQRALDLTFLPHVIMAPVIDFATDPHPLKTGADAGPRALVRVCMAPPFSETVAKEICEMTSTSIDLDGHVRALYIPTAFKRDARGHVKRIQRAQVDRARDIAEKQGREKYADFLARESTMSIDERLAFCRAEEAKIREEETRGAVGDRGNAKDKENWA
ncbi:hypothetical protein SPBR_04454 [Sporothrix brasiliensis 5110]|uniref:Uncharacterized protein n=1 Tax=Sporothrix brasiliensis 5110 TaxID=1398154 RepID=A0A0C2J8S1_9PEZI|nr:uncharacterized protein SPBR_04454 [Sporothrix brasiliensis 5110]KIH93377.1 hypothetical protein SPBR_04454 [Sporothrix brasiliensis 5110]